jgi:hypothetical protein
VPQRAVRRLIFDGSRRSIADLSKVRNEPWSRLHVRTSRYYRYYRSEFWTRNSFETLSEFCVFFQRRFWCCWSGSLVRSMINCMRQKSLVRILWSVLFLQKRLMFHVIWRCDPHFPKVQEGYEEFATVPVLMSCCIKVMWKTHIYICIFVCNISCVFCSFMMWWSSISQKCYIIVPALWSWNYTSSDDSINWCSPNETWALLSKALDVSILWVCKTVLSAQSELKTMVATDAKVIQSDHTVMPPCWFRHHLRRHTWQFLGLLWSKDPRLE